MKQLINMKKQLLLLLLLGLMPISVQAEEDYPNALVINITDGTEKAFQLEGTTLQFQPDSDMLQVSTDGTSNSFSLSQITGIAYEYRDFNSLGISSITLSNALQAEVYSLDGRKVSVEFQSLQGALNTLSKGVYIIKVNGRTLKIAK